MLDHLNIVGKIGSMALIRPGDLDIDYNTLSRISAELRPGMVWVTSGATEIGRIDHIKRTGQPLPDDEAAKADYAAQGQAILMASYRQFVRPEYGLRQLLVEHQHFNDPEKREHIRHLLLRAAEQGAVPIVNYNDPVSDDENRKMELSHLRAAGQGAVECVDNDETAAVLADLVGAKTLVILTSTEGIYLDPHDPATLVREVLAAAPEALADKIRALQAHCHGASRAGAHGAYAKLAYILPPACKGTQVIIGHARHRLSDLLEDRVPHTRIGLK
ncbi:MAG: uridylate kinase [Oscillospiraceae bacterium]|jgi:glutamate 5-kinase|nr:uridylate kinase [Oscillospiraceae bacterium]